MRSRNIKPGFFKNEILAECDPLARILFTGLWCYTDKCGICEYRPRRIKAEILPYDDVEIEPLLNQLRVNGFIQIYTIEKCNYLKIINFKKHQHPHHTEKESVLPDINSEITVKQLLFNGDNPSDSLIPDSNTSYSDFKKQKSKPERCAFSDDDMNLSKLLNYLLEENNPKRKPTTESQLESWANECRLMRERDGRSIEDIEKVLRWSQSDSFWKTNILSMGKLRKQFDQLMIRMNGSDGGENSKTSGNSPEKSNPIFVG